MSATAKPAARPTTGDPDRIAGEHGCGRDRRSRSPVVVCGALLLGFHGLVHVGGFATAWGLSGGLMTSRSYTLVGGSSTLELRLLGLLWMASLALFLAAAVCLSLGRPCWHRIALGATLLSLLVCLLWLEPAKVGAMIDLTLLIGLLISSDSGTRDRASGFDSAGRPRPAAPSETLPLPVTGV
jgi:hypothetical protein